MRKACLIGTFSLLFLLCAIAPARAQAPQSGEAVRVATPGAGVAPSLNVSVEGRATLVWQDDAPSLWAAHSPLWLPEQAALPSEALSVSALASRDVSPLSLAYTYPTSQTLMIQRMTLGGVPIAPQPFPNGGAFALDKDGLLATAWAETGRLMVWRESTGLTQTLSLPPEVGSEAQAVATMRLAVDDRGEAHLAWTLGPPSGAAGDLYFAMASGKSAPTLVADEVERFALRTGSEGRAHLAWVQTGTLYYAQSDDWGQVQAVAPLSGREALFALAAGPGGVGHLVWHDKGQLWYANAADWRNTRQMIAEGTDATWLDATTDGQGRLHLAWTAREGEGATLFYRRLFEPPPQLVIVYPLADDLLLADAEARASATLAPGELLRVEFYLEPEGDGAWIELGVDGDGDDGWSAPLRLADLQPVVRYRVVALGVMPEGRILRASGPWFAAQPPTRPQLWLYDAAVAPPEADVRQVSLWSPSAETWPTRLDLYAQPVQPDRCAEGGGCAPVPSAQPHYLGSHTLDRAPGLALGADEVITFSVRALPEGAYTLAALASQEGKPSTWFTSHEMWRVVRRPRVTVAIAAPSSAVVSGPRLVLAAQLDDPLGSVRRVDFYLERVTPALVEGWPEDDVSLAAPDLLWVGSDSEGLDGWMVNLMVNDYWLGGPWKVWALAYDERGLADSACSPQPFTIRGASHAQVEWIAPLGERPLAGVEPIAVAVRASQQNLTITAHLVEEGGQRLIGALAPEQEEERWRLDWDTRTAPDGWHRLLLMVGHADGFHSIYPSAPVQVANAARGLEWASPTEGEAQTGIIILSIQHRGANAIPVLRPARAYLRDGDGRVLPIGELAPDASGWRGVWDSHAVLDGDYTLMVLAPTPDDRLAHLERQVTIRNRMPLVAWGALREVWRGVQRLEWRAESQTGQPLPAMVEYSPDDGKHWVTLAPNAVAGVMLWDTRKTPDSTQGRLRVTACAGDSCAREVSPRLTVDNTNQPPALVLLNPSAGLAQGREVRVWWRAWDPDGDALAVDLAYRRGEEAWQTLFSDVADQGPYLWDTRALPAGDDYALRLTVRDGRGGEAMVTQTEIALSDNTPPAVRLVWPDEGVRLSDEVAILYHATDHDNDPLTIDLHYSENGGRTWLPIAEGLENSGYYVWRVSFLPPGAQYRLRVVAHDGLHRAMDESDGVLAIGRMPQARVNLWWPQGGETLTGVQLVRWAVSDPERRTLRAEVSMRFAGATLWWPLASDLPNDGVFFWDTRRLPDGAYALRVTLSNETVSASAVTTGAVKVQNHGNRAPVAALFSPQGGEAWSGLREITWQAHDGDGDVITATVSVSDDGGRLWQDVARVDATLGMALWDTATWSSGERYLVRLWVSDGQATTEARSAGTFSLANRQAMPPHVAALALRGAESLAGGGLLTWLAEDADGDPLTVDVGSSADGGATWEALATGLADVGEFVLPRNLAAGEQLHLVVADGLYRVQSVLALEATALVESQRPEVEIISPAEGAVWSGVQEVLWHASDPLGQRLTMHLEVSADGGLAWQLLASGLPNTGQWPWDTSTAPNGFYRLRLTADNGRFARAHLSTSFELRNAGREAPTVTLLAPRGGEVWSGMQEIHWQAHDADGDALAVRLFYSTDRGAQWMPLSPPLADTGSYVCDATVLPNAEEVWLAITAADGVSTARAVSAGAVAVRNAQGPLLRLTAESGAPQWQGVQRLHWRTAHAAYRDPQVSLEISSDEGPWRALATGLPPQGVYAWDTATLPEGARVRLRAVARDGLAQGVAYLWGPITVRGNATPPWQPIYPR